MRLPPIKISHKKHSLKTWQKIETQTTQIGIRGEYGKQTTTTL